MVDVASNSQLKESISKWKAAGADFYFYSLDMNCLEKFYKGTPGYPYNVFIKDWEKLKAGHNELANETSIKNAFGF